ncbi:hypothetical protein CYMTET_10067 [Cymbomonas tetramitiformis]|uniref:Uncharacterized protein n=1 Tax=Cymbomonas tetramitiformis TaxID=36881 RepID=A0AAE0GRG8_9CHLO|nr:hypothetical protein CYMTET_10067 [Cymbomonas tetramitiformis]
MSDRGSLHNGASAKFFRLFEFGDSKEIHEGLTGVDRISESCQHEQELITVWHAHVVLSRVLDRCDERFPELTTRSQILLEIIRFYSRFAKELGQHCPPHAKEEVLQPLQRLTRCHAVMPRVCLAARHALGHLRTALRDAVPRPGSGAFPCTCRSPACQQLRRCLGIPVDAIPEAVIKEDGPGITEPVNKGGSPEKICQVPLSSGAPRRGLGTTPLEPQPVADAVQRWDTESQPVSHAIQRRVKEPSPVPHAVHMLDAEPRQEPSDARPPGQARSGSQSQLPTEDTGNVPPAEPPLPRHVDRGEDRVGEAVQAGARESARPVEMEKDEAVHCEDVVAGRVATARPPSDTVEPARAEASGGGIPLRHQTSPGGLETRLAEQKRRLKFQGMELQYLRQELLQKDTALLSRARRKDKPREVKPKAPQQGAQRTDWRTGARSTSTKRTSGSGGRLTAGSGSSEDWLPCADSEPQSLSQGWSSSEWDVWSQSNSPPDTPRALLEENGRLRAENLRVRRLLLQISKSGVLEQSASATDTDAFLRQDACTRGQGHQEEDEVEASHLSEEPQSPGGGGGVLPRPAAVRYCSRCQVQCNGGSADVGTGDLLREQRWMLLPAEAAGSSAYGGVVPPTTPRWGRRRNENNPHEGLPGRGEGAAGGCDGAAEKWPESRTLRSECLVRRRWEAHTPPESPRSPLPFVRETAEGTGRAAKQAPERDHWYGRSWDDGTPGISGTRSSDAGGSSGKETQRARAATTEEQVASCVKEMVPLVLPSARANVHSAEGGRRLSMPSKLSARGVVPAAPPLPVPGSTLRVHTWQQAAGLSRVSKVGELYRQLVVSTGAGPVITSKGRAGGIAPTSHGVQQIVAEIAAQSPYLQRVKEDMLLHRWRVLYVAKEVADAELVDMADAEALLEWMEDSLSPIEDEHAILRSVPEWPELRADVLREAVQHHRQLREAMASIQKLACADGRNTEKTALAALLPATRALVKKVAELIERLAHGRELDERRYCELGIPFDWTQVNKAKIALCDMVTLLLNLAINHQKGERRAKDITKDATVVAIVDVIFQIYQISAGLPPIAVEKFEELWSMVNPQA